MQSDAASVPAEKSMLCEGCGYTLDGLPVGSRCPECGKLVSESTEADLRRPAAWEDQNDPRPALRRFLATSSAALFQPTRFFRTLATRTDSTESYRFAMLHWVIASVLFGVAAAGHWLWYLDLVRPAAQTAVIIWALTSTASLLSLITLTRIAAWLTAFEARWRGLRMPLPAVRTAMHYHAAHYLPVAIIAMITTVGYDRLWHHRLVSPDSYTLYFYVICGEVVLGAVYLFWTYWLGMRNIMYANR